MKLIIKCGLIILLSNLILVSTTEAKDKSGGKYGAINIGPTGILGYFEKGSPNFIVLHVYPKSPAHGKVQAGDRIISINGKILDTYPGINKQFPKDWYERKGSRYILGAAITLAEATDGKVKLGIVGKSSVSVSIPVLGVYSPTWPINCKKSEQIVRDIADFLREIQRLDGTFAFPKPDISGDPKVKKGKQGGLPNGLSGFANNSIGYYMAGLFLLSTNEEKDLQTATKFAATCHGEPGKSSWYLGYRGLFLGEYYLRTGDPKARETLTKICNALTSSDKVGSWAHRIDSTSAGYVRGGLMNQAGTICFMTFMLARESGIEVDDAGFLRTLHFFYKFAGKGSTPYGDHRPRINGNANGKGPSTVCAYMLMNDPRIVPAAQNGAVTAVDSYYGFEGGHTGNGFNVIWRGIAAAHVPQSFDRNRQRFMNGLAWYYDLVRGHDGSARILPVPGGEARYASTCWGTGAIGLHYTAHRKTLRITGKPRDKFNVNPVLPSDKQWRWFEEPDSDFLKLGFCDGGKDILSKIEEYYHMEPTIEQCEIMMRHYDPAMRKFFANKLSQIGTDNKIDPKALDAIERALRHSDQRVQRAATDAISGYHPWFSIGGSKSITYVDAETIGKRFVPYLLKILKDPKTDVWLKDGALWAMAKADGKTIGKHLSLIESFDNHRIWWLRQSARWRVFGLSQSRMVTFETIEAILKAKETEGRAFATVDLTKNLQLCTSGGSFNATQRATIIKKMVGDRMQGGELKEKLDAYGYKQISERLPGDASGFYPLIQGFPAENYIATFPLLFATIDRYADPSDKTPIPSGFGMMFFGVKRFNGVMGVMMKLGDQSRPVMARLNRFLNSNELAIARTKSEKLKTFDPYIVRLKESVGQWEKKFGKINVDSNYKVDLSGWRNNRRVKQNTPAGVECKDVTWTGTFHKEEVESTKRKKAEKVIKYYILANGERIDLSTQLLDQLPILYQQLPGKGVVVTCKISEKNDKRKKKKKAAIKIENITWLEVVDKP